MQIVRKPSGNFKCLPCAYLLQICEMLILYDFRSTVFGSVTYFALGMNDL